MPEMSQEMRRYLHEELIVKSGCIRGEGCPFVKSKGVHTNAVYEVYSGFDHLMLKVVDRWLINQRG